MGKSERLKILTEDEILRIHENSLKILAEIGVYMHSDEVLKICRDCGLEADMKRRLVKILPDTVEKCLAQAPERVQLFDRKKTLHAELGTGNNYTASGHNAIYVLDYKSTERKNATKEDVARFALISDYLPDIDIVGIEAMPQDVKPEASLVHAVDAVLNNTIKPIFFSPEKAEVAEAVFSVARIAGDTAELKKKPFLVCQLSPTSPLTWEKGAGEALARTVLEGVPLCLLPQPFAGVTAPYTMAGHLTVHNAEALSGIVLSQLITPGSPVIYGSAWSTFDMRQANVLIGSPETVLMRIAGAQIAEYYHIPYHTIAPDTDTHVMDEQLSWEKFATTWAAFLGHSDLIVNGGMFSTGLTVSMEQLVLDNEIISYVKQLSRGIRVDEDTLALDVIKKVGPRGEYLGEGHTLKHLGSHWEPMLSTRDIFENWRKKGMKDVVEKAHDKAEWIVKNHTARHLSGQQCREIDRAIGAFEKSISKWE